MPFLSRDYTHYVQLEASFDVSPGAVAGADAFKSRTQFPFERVKARLDRDRDAGVSASVITTQGGRESSTWEVEGDIIPSTNASTPTEPDMDVFFEAHMGTKHKATAHTTTAAGSSGTTLNLTAGGGAASGIQAGDLIAVDIDGAGAYEVRRVISIATDVVTIDRAFTTNPAAARAVKVGTTYRLSVSALKTVRMTEFLSGNNFRHQCGGLIPRVMELSCDFTEKTPVGTVKFSGDGSKMATYATSEPTAVLAGLPLTPAESKIWIGATKQCLNSVEVNSDNGNELRQNESCGLVPTGVKKTGNNGKYSITQKLAILLLTTGGVDGYFDNATSLTAYDIIVQLGISPGSIVAWCTPKFIPDVPVDETEGEVSLELSGRCYGTNGDDELFVAFI